MRRLTLLLCAVTLAVGCGDNSPPVDHCGDGVLDQAEVCDDGNGVAGDGCSACAIDHGFLCTGAPSDCVTRCGDGLIAGAETCDDGNTTAGDGCSATCAVEHGQICGGEPSTCMSTCGDGFVASDEECDDHNTDAGDGCDATCHGEAGWVCDGEPSSCAATCGDGIISGAEECDDHNAVNTDGCSDNCKVEHGYACTGAPSTCTSTCGDGIVASNEACDDHGTAPGDGCDATCEVEHGFTCAAEPSSCASACGDGIVASDEECDDHGTAPGDGCDGSCKVEHGFTCGSEPSTCASTCGDGIVASDEACDDHDTAPGDGCDASCELESGWTCSGEPTGCDAICGDGLKVGAEQCDDHNTTNLDGCSDSCQVDMFDEVEPNDTTGTANGPYGVNVRIRGRVAAPSDVDTFAITLTTTTDLELETFDLDGLNVCNNADTVVTLVGTDGSTELATDDDGGLGRCSLVKGGAARHLAPGTYYVRVQSFGGDQLIPGYNLVVRAAARCGDGSIGGAEQCDGGPGCTATCDRTLTCGDGFVDGAEQCDDHNANPNDGCSPGCAWEPQAEVEPNDSRATATGPLPPNRLMSGAIGAAGDVDYYVVNLLTTTDLAIETFDGTGPGHCANIDTSLALYDGTGALLLTRDQGGIGNCSMIDPERAVDSAARHLPAGKYFIAVHDFNDDGAIAAYTLRVLATASCGDGVTAGGEECDGGAGCGATCDRVPVCGDGFVDGSEQCDDHGTATGDGCDAACQLERTAEVEPNDTSATAVLAATPARVTGAISPKGDSDWFAVTLTATSDVALGVTRADGSCGIDTEMFFYGPDGTTVLASNDDAGGTSCSALFPATDPAMRRLAAGTYYVRVHDFGDDVVIPDYLLQIAVTATCGDGVVGGWEECDGGAGCSATCERVPSCGDGYVDAPETCDDGRTVDGDGCSAICQIETLGEAEPNGTTAEADAAAVQLTGATTTVTGAIGAAGDHDVFKLVIAADGLYRFETFSDTGACTVATTLSLLDAAGATLYTDLNSGVAACSSLRLYLAAGTYYVQVQQRSDAATIAAYQLAIGPVTAGGAETEPNDTRATGAALAADAYILGGHQTSIDLDYVAIVVPAGKGVRAEVIEGSGAETCESNGIDSTLTLFDATGVILAKDDDSGRGLCSLIDGTGATPAVAGASHLAGGTYYLSVDASPFAQNQASDAAKFDYRLVVEVR